MNFKHLFKSLILSFTAILGAATSVAATKEDVRVPENRVIYEVFVRNFSAEGNLRGVEAQIPRLKELGVDVVWLMPIYAPGETDRWGTFASPYAVRDYKKIDPFYGTDDDFRSLVDAIHAQGMEIWLDWVANHTSTDHAWVSQHPEYYGGNPYHPHGWNDVYQLDYSNQELRRAMIDALQYWVREFDIDGYRCDYAEGVPRDFWSQARSAVNSIKDIAWLAESGGTGDAALLVKETFDYNYAWGYNDRLLEFGTGNMVSMLADESYKLHYPSDADCYRGKSRMVYLSNHDVVQDKNGTEDRHFGANLEAMTVLQFTIYGMPLIYNGQEVRYSSGAVSLAEKTPIDWNSDAGMTSLIKKLTYLKHTEPALRTGSQTGDLINHSADNRSVYVYERRNGDHSVVVMLNFSDSRQTFNVTSELPANKYHDVFTGQESDFGVVSSFSLPAKGYAVYVKGDDDPVDIRENVITFRRPDQWTNIPHVHVYYRDETSGKDVNIIDNQPMEPVSRSGDLFCKKVYGLRDGYTVMFNNGGWVNGQSDGGFYEAVAGDYTYALTSGLKVVRDGTQTDQPSQKSVYIHNGIGWSDMRLYAWGDAEVFGVWPGATPSGTKTVGGVDYLVFPIPDSAIGKSVSLIINDNGNSSTQLDDYRVILDGDIYLNAAQSGVTTGVGSVETDPSGDVPCYYTILGQRVENPSAGLYVVRCGDDVRKVLIR